jgi:photosystem II stability/assembly factor-like uncharacterized protein
MTYMKSQNSFAQSIRGRSRNSGASRTARGAGVALMFAGMMSASAIEAQTWQTRASGTAQNLTAVVFSTATTAAAVGANTAITVSSDGGSTWASQTLGDGATLNAVFSAGTTIATVGDDRGGGGNDLIAASGDRGATWGYVSGPGNDDDLTAGIFVTSIIAVAVEDNGGTGEIYVSQDRGATWVQDALSVNDPLNAVHSRGSLVIVVGDDQGPTEAVARSTSSGALGTWVAASVVPGTGEVLNDVVVINSTSAVAVGNAGEILNSTDAGDNWGNPFTVVGTPDLNAVDSSSDFVVAVGDGGTIVRSTDAGANWVLPTTNTATNNLNDVVFLTGAILLAVGDNGEIYGSEDYGDNWTAQTSGVASNLLAIAYNGLNGTLVVGDAGVVLLSLNQISVTTPIPFQSKWLLVGLLVAVGLLALRRFRPTQ